MARGGARKGAGRPKGQGQYGESTQPIRLPVSLIKSVMKFVKHKGYQLPLYSSKVQAGFPSPADDHIEGHLDLNEHLIKHPAATFFVRASGHSMIGAGIHENDILIIDTAGRDALSNELIKELTSVMTKPKVDMKNPDVIINIEIFKEKTAISLLRKNEILKVSRK